MIPTFRKTKIKSSLKKSLKRAKLKPSVEKMAWLNYILFMKTLAAECQTQAVAEKSKVIKVEHVRAVRKVVFRKLRG